MDRDQCSVGFGNAFIGCFGKESQIQLPRMDSNASWNWYSFSLLSHIFFVMFYSSASQMKSKSDGSCYELCGHSDISLGRLFWYFIFKLFLVSFFLKRKIQRYRKFDVAVAGFCTCVGELVQHITQADPCFLFPYSIQKDRIGNVF